MLMDQALIRFWQQVSHAEGLDKLETDVLQTIPDATSTWQMNVITGQLLMDMTKKLKLKAAQGISGWRAREFQCLPLEAWSEFALLIQQCLQQSATPSRWRTSLVTYLPKEAAASEAATLGDCS